MKRRVFSRLAPLLLVGLLAACAPGPQEPAPLEPLAPMTEVPMTETPMTEAPDTTVPETTVPEVIVPETAAPEVETVTPEEPTVTVIPATPEVEAAPMSGGMMSGGSVITDPSDPGIPSTIGISADNQTFVSATAEDQSSITLPAGSTFYLQIRASDPDGITNVAVELRNSDAAGTLPTGPFAVASSDCEAQVASTPTELTCTVAVTIAPDATNVQQEGETAYAFRPLITDAAGNADLAYSWGYLIVQ